MVDNLTTWMDSLYQTGISLQKRVLTTVMGNVVFFILICLYSLDKGPSKWLVFILLVLW